MDELMDITRRRTLRYPKLPRDVGIAMQYDLEMLSIEKGIERFQKTLESKHVDPSNIASGKRLMQGHIDTLSLEIMTEQLACVNRESGVGRNNYGPMLIWGDADQLAVIALSSIINSVVNGLRSHRGLSKYPTDQWVCLELGKRVKLQYTINEVKKHEPKLVKLAEKITKGWTPSAVRWLQEKYGRATREWKHKHYVAVGSILLRMVLDHTDLFLREKKWEGGKWVYSIRMTPETLQLYTDTNEMCELRHPAYQPMVATPRPVMDDGPFLFIPKTHIKSSQHPTLPPQATDCHQAMDYMNGCRWAVEDRTLDVMDYMFNQGGRHGVVIENKIIIPSIHQMPMPPKNEVAMEQSLDYRRQWCTEAAQIWSKNATGASKLIEFDSVVKQGQELSRFEDFSFTYSQCWRGRYYPDQAVINPQAADAGRGMLVAANRRPLGPHGWKWLRIHIASLFGVDKGTIDERLAWVMDNRNDLIDSARNPTNGNQLWLQADYPWQALTALFEFEEIMFSSGMGKDYCDYMSRVICKIDGTCNGLQHLSAMGRDILGGALVNLVPGDRPNDIYMTVADIVLGHVDVDYLHNINLPGLHESVFWKAKLDEPKARRKVCKRGPMTKPYGVTTQGMRDQLIEDEHTDSWDEANYLTTHLESAIRQTVIKGMEFMDWLQATAEAVQGPMSWYSETGFETHQDYKSTRERRIKTAFGDMVQHPFTDKTDTRKQVRGIVPNFVHNVDSEHFRRVALACMRKGIPVLQCIHDAFGTQAGDMEFLYRVTPVEFVRVHETNPHLRLLEDLAEQYPEVDLPEPPAQGELDLNLIKDKCHYAFI